MFDYYALSDEERESMGLPVDNPLSKYVVYTSENYYDKSLLQFYKGCSDTRH